MTSLDTLLTETERYDSPLTRDQALALVAEVRRLRVDNEQLRGVLESLTKIKTRGGDAYACLVDVRNIARAALASAEEEKRP
jgi:hypothetical protein